MPPVDNIPLRKLYGAQDVAVVKRTWEEAERIVKAQTGVFSSLEEPRRVLVVSLLAAAMLAVGTAHESTDLADVDAFLFTRDKSFKEVAEEIRRTSTAIEPIRRFIQGVGNQLVNLSERSRDPVFMALNAVLYDLRINATRESKFQTYGVGQA